MNRTFFLLLTITPVLLGGCSGMQIASKQGAGADSLAVAEAQCRAQSNYEQCMRAQGWTIHKRDGDDLLMMATPSENRSPGAPASKPLFVPAAPASKDSKAPAPPPDPLTKHNVSSWWKMGGGPEELKSATAACVTKLGPAHQPQPDSPLVTRGLILCLKEQGWSGLQGY